jgi:hypothetical protein
VSGLGECLRYCSINRYAAGANKRKGQRYAQTCVSTIDVATEFQRSLYHGDRRALGRPFDGDRACHV